MTQGYEALRHGAACLDLSTRGRIIARGRDRARLLHNVTSNDVKRMTPGSGAYAFLLTPQGRVQADLNLLCFSDHFLIDTEPELREKVQQLILKYKVADQVELEDITGGSAEIGIEGPGAAALLESRGALVPAEPYAHTPWGDSLVANLSVTGQPGFRIFGPAAEAGSFLNAGARLASESDIRLVRIENGRPRFGEDIRETSLPQETQQMHAVSFQKGCYIGQEIVERIRAQGHVNKKLVRLAIDGAVAPPPGTKLGVEGKDAGELTSAVYSPALGQVAALAYARIPFTEPGTIFEAGEFRGHVV
ncbi:MAG: folate-binding protein YgfZ [Acidobacteriia bacterium]|nr:folate-binding protein YgfZ [Terriglobia bacterium]